MRRQSGIFFFFFASFPGVVLFKLNESMDVLLTGFYSVNALAYCICSTFYFCCAA